MFIFYATVRLHDTDAAGRLFFAHQFRIAHEAYEAFMDALGFPLNAMLKSGRVGLPIARAEADYKLPLALGDRLAIEVKPIRVGDSFFTLLYRITRAGQTVGRVRTVHVAVRPARGLKCPLPARLRGALIKLSG